MPIDITNVMSRIMCSDIELLDGDDEVLDCLECCVDMDNNFCFSLKDGIDYNTVLSDNITVQDFLKEVAGERMLLFLSLDRCFKNDYQDYLNRCKNNIVLYKKKGIRKKISNVAVASFLE